MTLFTTIAESIKDAMRAKDSARLEVLRGIKTAFTNELVATRRTPQDTLTDEEALSVITRLSKQRKDSIAQFTAGGRTDLAEKEAFELTILEGYLPTLMTREEIVAFVTKKLKSMPKESLTNTGIVIGSLMRDLKGKADGAIVKEVVNEILS